jgi:hypothetical protein
MQLDLCGGFEVGHQPLLRQEQHQGCPLPQLVRNGPVPDNLFSFLQDRRWEHRAVAWEGTTHGRHPLAKASVATGKMLLILATREPENHSSICETEHLVARKGASQTAEHTIREQWIGSQKMIVVLSDSEVEEMITIKSLG